MELKYVRIFCKKIYKFFIKFCKLPIGYNKNEFKK